MKLTNNEIYNLAQQLIHVFQDEERLPIKLGLIIQKNKKILLTLAQEIEQARILIAQKYGTLNTETQQYQVEPHKLSEAQQELENLFNIEQEVDVCMIDASILNSNIELSISQIEAILFMIEEV